MELLRLDRRRRLLPVRIMCILFFEPVCSFYEIPAGVLRGTGHAMSPVVSTMVGTCVFRIVWICTVFRIYSSLAMHVSCLSIIMGAYNYICYDQF